MTPFLRRMLHTADVPPAEAAIGNLAPRSYCCTGVMLSDDLFLTNHHCGSLSEGAGWTQGRCDRAVVDLGWEEDGVRRQFACRAVEAQNLDLDYALLRLAPVRGSEGARGGAIAARRATTPPAVGDAVFVIHHALCSPKLVSRRCALRDRRPAWTGVNPGTTSEWGHDCDTEPGASGAPVFNRRAELVALHHLGFKQCGGGDRLNSAVAIDPIALDIRGKAPTAAAEIGW